MQPISILLPVLVVVPAWALLLAYPDGPDPRLTGGFQERDCTKCHADHPLNAGRALGGDFRIDGVPTSYEQGRSYRLRVVAGHPGQRRWGFELSVRFAHSGRQAGELAAVDSLTQVKHGLDIDYAMHTAQGSRWGTVDGPVVFEVDWTAPQTGAMVLFNAAGNAADGSDDEHGDFIYSAGAFSLPAGAASPPIVAAAAQPTERPAARRRSETPLLIHLPIPLERERNDVEVQIQHAFSQSIDAGIGNLFGLDSGANVDLAVGYAVADRLSASVARAGDEKIMSLSGTFDIHRRGDSRWALSLHAGVEGKDNFQRAYSPFLQLTTALDVHRLRLYAVPTMVFNSRDEQLIFPGVVYVHPEDNHTFSLGLGADVALSPRLSLMGEWVPRLGGFGGFFDDNPSYAAGVKMRTWGHVFSLFVTRSRDFTPAKYAVNAEFPADKVSFGFNIYRKIH